ncbi:hypothetical protein VPNG_02337 [Cytospora leucostoma]|uniref:Uncharacterized protein n=1 Tax=Cytospora leucostoma TaxID=1230097 RepID=A0A423XHJ2_9PEZI|nr:hypothetical protein VPNG_02337 [Cytospora leucostoma]
MVPKSAEKEIEGKFPSCQLVAVPCMEEQCIQLSTAGSGSVAQSPAPIQLGWKRAYERRASASASGK